MNYVIAGGAISLGIVVGWMVYHTFVRQEKLDAKFLGSIVSVMVGASVIGIFQKVAGTNSSLPQEVYLYPVGLLIGIVATATVKFIGDAEKRHEQRTARGLESAKDSIVQHITHKGFRMMSFTKLKADLGKDQWSDDYIRAVIARYPSQIRNATVKGGRPGVALIVPEDEG
jgi:hypothetical protein